MKANTSIQDAGRVGERHFLKARRLQSRGQFDDAITAYEADIKQIAMSGALTPAIELQLHGGIEQSLHLLRWNREYSRALNLLEGLHDAFPDLAQRYDVDAAMFRIARGDIDDGIGRLREMIDADPDNIYLRIALGAELIGLNRYDEAERSLRTATVLDTAPAVERAQACWLLFDLYRRKPDVNQADDVWQAACKLDPMLTANRTQVIRSFIYWGSFERAAHYLRQETNEARRHFYGGLGEFSSGRSAVAMKVWRALANRQIDGIEGCPDEYAEACLYLNEPRKALESLRPLVDEGHISVWRLILLGLAYALVVDIPSAKHFLNISLRLADTARPRETRPGTGDQIIHGGPARETYGRIITATDLRAELDVFFIPLLVTARA